MRESETSIKTYLLEYRALGTRTWLSYQSTEYPCLRLCEIDWIRLEYPWVEYCRDIPRFTNPSLSSNIKNSRCKTTKSFACKRRKKVHRLFQNQNIFPRFTTKIIDVRNSARVQSWTQYLEKKRPNYNDLHSS